MSSDLSMIKKHEYARHRSDGSFSTYARVRTADVHTYIHTYILAYATHMIPRNNAI